ncbi:uncharacterized protein LOC127812230 [Diospyros lotus]|uniref:uncharacterized protein LOC127812230 n=1 Tax=Diospyros lotus TaxID=55363 RepID=UPI002257E00D|nr:uncharacterized protein LOC127812230 [Diospyros lotus]
MKYINEMFHFSHPQHKLKYHYSEVPFKCDGCKEVGIGSRYKCSGNSGGGGACDFDLHVHCALIPSPPTLLHPFYTKCSFQFLPRPPGTIPRYCNACERDVAGFVYHCRSCGFDLHPCCAKLPMVLQDGHVKLYLCRKVGTSCHRCGRKGGSWSYRSACKKYNFHVACVKEMLVENWHDIYFGHHGIAGGGGGSRMVDSRIIPSLNGGIQSYHNQKKSKGKVKKGCEMAGLALQFVVSAVLGDPTTLIAGVVGSLISK